MRTSLQKLNKKTEIEIQQTLLQLIADLRSPQEAEQFFQALFTSAERSTFAKRLAIAVRLKQGHSYQQIKDSLKVSSATISKTQDNLGSLGFTLVFKKIIAEQWANHWAKKLLSPFKK